MNKIQGQISNIEVNGSLSLVTTKVKEVLFKAIVIETPETASYLTVGNTINLLFKETEVVIATGNTNNISLQNQVNGIVEKLEKGALLSQLNIKTVIGDIVSIITTNAISQLNIEEGNTVTAMIKTNEISISK
ncbi:TOBE domain-containing protein [Aquimarina gracilis]|uniref:TOBE domain-containing protein n=1 Tax=Aquimarina gracilis TaxID=874422 RepID=A0ABU5ZZI4_9FLAO|nr:TOBE domain-containing protein [Aquimarina gracilis]MEB3347236.1 TOBE domain-containing protein [Aquimarina gracilis]